MTSVIEVTDLEKIYKLTKPLENGKKELQAIAGVSFSVEKGEIFGILGPNGAGKTTTLEIMEALKRQTSGEVKLLGFDNLTSPQEIKKRIGVQLQSSEYLPAIRLGELLGLFASLYGRKANPAELLGFVGLQEKINEEVKSLSGGQKQRFTIASSLVNEPDILFLDEPTTGLDPRARRDVWQLIRSINERGITIVMTTHYMEEAEFLCNRVAIMDHGKILKIDEPKRLINDLAHTTQVSFLVEGEIQESIWQPVKDEIEKIYSNYPKVILEIKSLDAIAKIIDILKQGNISFSGFTVKTASLEDVYLDLTGREYGE
jgi:ABC-2 type transport system ATP-binding protein